MAAVCDAWSITERDILLLFLARVHLARPSQSIASYIVACNDLRELWRMRISTIEELPQLEQSLVDLQVVAGATQCVVRDQSFIAQFSLDDGKVAWVVERHAPLVRPGLDYRQMTRDFRLADRNLWLSESQRIVVELHINDDGELMVDGRCWTTGTPKWNYRIGVPEQAAWAEKAPAWPDAATEELHAFIADSPTDLVVCLFRQTRREGRSTPEFTALDIPEHKCQLDVFKLDPKSGLLLADASHLEVKLSILERRCFQGCWSNGDTIGMLDLESGASKSLMFPGKSFGTPKPYGDELYIPWHDKTHVGYLHLSSTFQLRSEYFWPEKLAKNVSIWPTTQGVGVQVNDQKLLWTESETLKWVQKAKPYIYRVFAGIDSSVFVATDGNGGRLFGFDRDDGHEVFNFRPAIGGLESAKFFEDYGSMLANVSMKKSYKVPPKLLRFDLKKHSLDDVGDCWKILGDWERGIVFVDQGDVRNVAFADLSG